MDEYNVGDQLILSIRGIKDGLYEMNPKPDGSSIYLKKEDLDMAMKMGALLRHVEKDGTWSLVRGEKICQ